VKAMVEGCESFIIGVKILISAALIALSLGTVCEIDMILIAFEHSIVCDVQDLSPVSLQIYAMEQLWFLLCSYGAAWDFALQLWSSFGFCSAAMDQLWILLCSYG
jgi:hypothetical protein